MKHSFQNERIIIFGASRGLGAAVTNCILGAELLLVSRTMSKGAKLKNEAKCLDLDFSRIADQQIALERAREFAPTRIFYFAGGGPYGRFSEKNWQDHEWALQVNFLFPAKIMHLFLKKQDADLRQIVFTGSAVAESKPDENAASYSTAKYALRALFENLRSEPSKIELRLFSPGYMDTRLLPKNAWPRESGKVLDPTKVADEFCEWVLDSTAAHHKIID